MLVISERAIVFVKIRLRYARTVVLYGLPESPDTLTACLSNLFDSENWKPILNTKLNAIKLHKELTEDQKLEETRQLLREKHTEKSLVGLFDNYDSLALERFVGTHHYRSVLQNQSKDVFNFK